MIISTENKKIERYNTNSMNTSVFSHTQEKLSGIVKRITFHNAENGWTVLKISPLDRKQEEVAVTIHQSKVFAGATIDFYGNWTNHPKYGNQFKAVKAVEQKPASANALEKYLGSGLIKGVGPVTAKRIVKHFGKDTLTVFDTEIERLTEVPGIAALKLQMIQKAWQEHNKIRDVMMFLQTYDISTLFAVKIYKTYGDNAIQIVSENPYKLAEDIYGIGFQSADKIALRMGIAENSPLRIKAAIRHVLASSRDEGHCYLTKEQIKKGVSDLLSIDLDEETAKHLAEMEQEDEVKVREREMSVSPQEPEKTHLVSCYYAHSLFYDEEYVAKKIQKLIKKRHTVDIKRVKKWIQTYCKQKNISLSDEQQDAIHEIVTKGVSVLTGGPGCGKTTTTRVLVMLLLAMKKKVLLAAPTGRASQRMTEVIGIQSKTLHRLLEWDASKGGFKRNEDSTLEADFLIIDESSMLDIHLAAAVLRAVKASTQLLFIGDADQLPSVGAGNVFKDFIASGIIPIYRLTKIFRQAQESSIITYAHMVNTGAIPRIESPFHKPSLWQEKNDCLFIDSDEATQDQLSFVKKVRYLAEKRATYHVADKPDTEKYFVKKYEKEPSVNENWYTEEEHIPVPDKYQHVNIDKLLDATSQTDQLRILLKRVHPWSSLNYGYSATQMVQHLYTQTIPKYLGPHTEIQILTPMTRGSLGTIQLNKVIQNTANPAAPGKAHIQMGDRIFRVGDRVIQKRNNYDLDVFNGDIGIIQEINTQDLIVTVAYRMGQNHKYVQYNKDALSEIDLAYAITIHKSQGSEFESVIMPLFTQHFSMLFRNLVYTGLTRAKKMAVFVGNRKALSMAVRNNKMMVRQTALQDLLGNVSHKDYIV